MLDFCMRATTLVVVLLGVVRLAGAGERPTLRGRETPRGTDLLRAERMAEEVEERRRVPTSSTGQGWARGGSGWERGRARQKEGSRGVTIKVAPPRKARDRKGRNRG